MATTFPNVIAFAFMAFMLLIGTVLRAKIPFLQNSLVPASLIGGVIGFILISMGLSLGYTARDFVPFTFHFFTLSFMSLVLTGSETNSGGKQSFIYRGGMWLALIWTISLALQALVGFTVIDIYNNMSGNDISNFLGAIATYGYTMGPGQAITYGGIWERNFGIENAATIGLIYATFGFIVTFVLGVPLARWIIKKGLNQNKSARIDEEFLKGYYNKESNELIGRQITHASNVDSFAWHIAILGLAYLLTNYFLVMMQNVIGDWRPSGIAVGVIFSYGLFFLWGLIICAMIRKIMDAFSIGHFIDNGTQKRITSSAVDFMVVGTVMGISVSVLADFLVPVLLTVVAVTAVTALLCFGLARFLSDLSVERGLTIFGCCCGSTGTGLLLLRILDPDFSSSVPKELVFFNVAILFTCFHIIVVMSPILPDYNMLTIWVVFAATIVVALAMLFAMGHLHRQSNKA